MIDRKVLDLLAPFMVVGCMALVIMAGMLAIKFMVWFYHIIGGF